MNDRRASDGGWDISGWMRYAMGGLIAGLVAWGGISGRVSALEMTMRAENERASEDRALFREAIQQLKGEIKGLSVEINAERLERVRDDAPPRRERASDVPVFKYPK